MKITLVFLIVACVVACALASPTQGKEVFGV